MTHENATPRPWAIFDSRGVLAIVDRPETCTEIIAWKGFDACDFSIETKRANQQLIVKAVNSYDAAQAMADAFGLVLSPLGAENQPSDEDFQGALLALSAFRKATGEGE